MFLLKQTEYKYMRNYFYERNNVIKMKQIIP